MFVNQFCGKCALLNLYVMCVWARRAALVKQQSFGFAPVTQKRALETFESFYANFLRGRKTACCLCFDESFKIGKWCHLICFLFFWEFERYWTRSWLRFRSRLRSLSFLQVFPTVSQIMDSTIKDVKQFPFRHHRTLINRNGSRKLSNRKPSIWKVFPGFPLPRKRIAQYWRARCLPSIFFLFNFPPKTPRNRTSSRILGPLAPPPPNPNEPFGIGSPRHFAFPSAAASVCARWENSFPYTNSIKAIHRLENGPGAN